MAEPFPHFLTALVDYLRATFDKLGADWVALRDPVLAALQTAHDQIELSGRPVLLHGDWKPSNLHWAGRLLVLDWEFAYARPSLMDVGQLLRWSAGRSFVDAFAKSYEASGECLSGD